MSDITIIGLGAMGSALASAYLAKGMEVTVWNRSAERAAPLVAKGARLAENAAGAIDASTLILVSVLDYPAVRDILRPAAAHLEGRTLVNVTNGTPDQAREMAAWAQSRGAAYVDGAVMVTPELVSGPEAFLLYSGNSAAYHRQEATLAVLGSSTYVGEDPALASVYDLSLLSAMFGMFGGYLHAAALVRSEGIPAAEVTPMIMSLLNAMIELFPETAREIDSGEHPTPSSNNAMMATALRNVLDGSREQRVSTALMEPIWALFDRASKEGLGDRDISALVPLIYSPDGARA